MLIFFGIISILFHVWAFIMESVLFMNPKIFKIFGLRTVEDAGLVKLMAFNQGFYNLFLALIMIAGLFLHNHSGKAMLGSGMLIASAFCMMGAGAVLIASKPSAWYAGVFQAVPPMLVLVKVYYETV
ncbi:MAG: DUF1304 domain-containing protein [Bacteriovoracaceae bacterium]|nr:DUF1304 domain-containing protein [Bacteriovoracaceae bacterium]